MDLHTANRTFILALLLIAPIASAESYDDPIGDVEAKVINQWVTSAPGWEGVDLTALNVLESPTFFRFEVNVSGLSQSAGGVKHDSSNYIIQFDYGGQPHAVGILRNMIEDAWYGNLYQVDKATGTMRWVGPLNGGGSDAEGMGWVEAPRSEFLDAHGAPPVEGSAFENLRVWAYAHVGGYTCCINLGGVFSGNFVEARDELNAGIYAIKFGGQQGTGGAELATKHPFRASNGGATTLRYSVQASFDGPQDEGNRTFSLEASQVPEGWRVMVPSTLEMAPGGVVDLEVLVDVPFVHQHGGSDTFDLVMASNDDGDDAQAVLSLGIHYLDVPQPSGHHPSMWLHSEAMGDFSSSINKPLGGRDGNIFMNGLQEDPADEGVEVVMSQWGVGGTNFKLFACLEPGLLMGLDIDMAGLGRIEVPIKSQYATDATLSGRVVHVGPGPEMRSCSSGQWANRDVVEVATFASDVVSLGTSATMMEADVLPHSDGDRIAFQEGAQLVLELTVKVDDLGRTVGNVILAPGGVLELPLLEYQDSRPAGLVGAPVHEGPSNGTTFVPVPVAKESPGVGFAALVGAVALVGLLRRRY